MAGLEVTITVDHGGIGICGAGTDEGQEFRVKHNAGCCGPCWANKDPRNVPYVGCTGNIAGRHPESVRARAVGNLCRCTVILVDANDTHEY